MSSSPLSFAERCGLHDLARQQALQQALQTLQQHQTQLLRFVWCDLHGATRGKTLVAQAAASAMMQGVGMVSTLMLKDSSDRTVYPVFDPRTGARPRNFGQANNLLLLADPSSLQLLPWAAGSAWVLCQPWHDNGEPVALDSRRVLQQALARLAAHGFGLCCGLELEFHIYRILNTTQQLDPEAANWPGAPPELALIHPGYMLLSEAWFDLCDEPLAIVRKTAQSLGLPLRSLEIELGPSQVEAVFEPCDALLAADRAVLFRSAVKQALRRAGYHASFICRPPFTNVMASGWHLHQSLVRLADGSNAMPGAVDAGVATPAAPNDAASVLSEVGQQYLAGLLAHAPAATVFATPSVNGFGRFKPGAMAPQAVLWGRDNRGAMLRVLGGPGDEATRIENRVGEPSANPYLYFAAQIYSGIDGLERQLRPPLASDDPYASGHALLPTSLEQGLAALQQDSYLVQAFGAEFVDYFCTVKNSEAKRYAQAQDPQEFERREYFSRV